MPNELSATWKYGILAFGTCLGLGISYLLFLAGEPQSVWLWRDIIGL